MSESLRGSPLPYRVWGEEFIDEPSHDQMRAAMRLPVSVSGALMADAHVGYGLPIGGVLATDGVVIPYAVGVDIACRMRLSIFDGKPSAIKGMAGKLEKALVQNTSFGMGASWSKSDYPDHDVLDDDDWNATDFVKSLQDKAQAQLGTSGSGNHFVEWGTFNLQEDDEALGLKRGQYLALLSHSGSRGTGYQIADRYSKLAMEQHPDLDKSVRHLAWLSLDSELGQEYWIAMQLAGRYAAANHEVIHRQVARAAGLKTAATVENHHNFAWKERVRIPGASVDKAVIVHRKGATPAGVGVMGIIPGSMGDVGYVVRGRGEAESLNSAAHGAGRLMSRKAAKQSITKTERDRYLQILGVKLIGGDLDEAPQAYKRIDDIMAAQADLVDVVGSFTPQIVRMDGGSKKR
jgi:tRNA-splicing ligase RtcB